MSNEKRYAQIHAAYKWDTTTPCGFCVVETSPESYHSPDMVESGIFPTRDEAVTWAREHGFYKCGGGKW